MAKPNQIAYDNAMQGIAAAKHWAGPALIRWQLNTVKRFPGAYSARIPLQIGLEIKEGLFVSLYYKQSLHLGVPDKISMTLLVDNARVLSIDHNGVSDHLNTVGHGLPYFKQPIPHPHLHVPVQEASSGYAEPLSDMGLPEMWKLFLSRANIIGAPDFELPRGQMPLI